MTKVYILDFSSKGDLEKYISFLNKKDKEELAKKKKNKTMEQFLFSRYLLKYALTENNIKYGEILRDNNGKPYFENNEICFNISHSGSLVAVALSDKNIGVDIQIKKAVSSSLKDKFFTQPEKDISPIMLWSIKESVVKYDGTGIFSDFKKNEIISEKGHFKIKNRNNLYINTFYYKTTCVCVCGEDRQTEIYICKI